MSKKTKASPAIASATGSEALPVAAETPNPGAILTMPATDASLPNGGDEESPAAETNEEQFPAENVGGDDEHPTFTEEINGGHRQEEVDAEFEQPATGEEVLAAIGEAQQKVEKSIEDRIEQVVQRIPLSEIMPSPTNPRKFIDQAEIATLAENIRQQGLMQPIIVRPLRSMVIEYNDASHGLSTLNIPPCSREYCAQLRWECGISDENTVSVDLNDDCGYEIVAGERRYRAHGHLWNLDASEGRTKWSAIDCIVRNLTDQQVLEQQVSENLQREDLTPLDWANAYAAMVIAERQRQPVGGEVTSNERGAVARVAARLGKSTSVVYQTMQLAKLIPEAATALRKEYITKNHAIDCARLDSEQQLQYLMDAFEIYDDVPELREMLEGNKGPQVCLSVRSMREQLRENDEPDLDKPIEEQLGEDTIEEAAAMRSGDEDEGDGDDATEVRRTPGGTVIPAETVFQYQARVRDKKSGKLGTIASVVWLGAKGYSGYHDVECDDGSFLRERPFDELEPLRYGYVEARGPKAAPKTTSNQPPKATPFEQSEEQRKARETDQKIMRAGLKKILTASHAAAKRSNQMLRTDDLRRVAEAMFFMLSSDQQETVAELLRWEIKPYVSVITQYSQQLAKIAVELLPQFLITCALAEDLGKDALHMRSNIWRSFETGYNVSLSAIRAEIMDEGKPKPAAKPVKKAAAKSIATKPAKKAVSHETYRTRAVITKSAKKATKSKPAPKPVAKAKKAGRK